MFELLLFVELLLLPLLLFELQLLLVFLLVRLGETLIIVPLSDVRVDTGDKQVGELSRTVVTEDVLSFGEWVSIDCCTVLAVVVVVVEIELLREIEPMEDVVFALLFVPVEGPEMELEVELVIWEALLA